MRTSWKRIQKHSLVKDRNNFAYCQPKALSNEYIMKNLGKYYYFENQKNTLLVWIMSLTKSEKNCFTKISIIPICLTRYLQSLNVWIDNPFKNELKKNIVRIALNKRQHENLSRRFNQLGMIIMIFRQIN